MTPPGSHRRNLRSLVEGSAVAQRNSQDGISMIQTTEGALTETSNILQRIRELALQAANGVNSDQNRAALDAEVQQLLEHIDDIAFDTEFNGIHTLSAAQTLTLQSGPQQSQMINVYTNGARAADLGVNNISISQINIAVATISIVDVALQSVNMLRADLGAIQNRLEFTISTLAIQEENNAYSESMIRDADVASETIAFTRNQILVSAEPPCWHKPTSSRNRRCSCLAADLVRFLPFFILQLNRLRRPVLKWFRLFRGFHGFLRAMEPAFFHFRKKTLSSRFYGMDQETKRKRSRTMLEVWLDGDSFITNQVSLSAARLQGAYSMSTRRRWGAAPVRFTSGESPAPFRVDRLRGVSIGTCNTHGIARYAGLSHPDYLLCLAMLGLIQWRALTLNQTSSPSILCMIRRPTVSSPSPFSLKSMP